MARTLVDIAGIAKRLGVVPRTVQRWANREDFPKPVSTRRIEIPNEIELPDGSRVPIELAGRRVWDLEQVDKWARDHLSDAGTLPRPGRPPKQRRG